MQCRIRALVAFTGMIVAMSFSSAVMVRAQAPAGPNRPAQVPEEYIVTPFGYFHPSCVVHLAKGEEVLEGGKVQKADGTIYTENLRAARATDSYILRGGGEEICGRS